MSFSEDISNYKDFNDTDIVYTYIPRGAITSIKGLLIKNIDNVNQLKPICYDLAGRVPTQPPTNWGWDFLINDYYDLVDALAEKLPKFMDFLLDFAKGEYRSTDFVDVLNEIFEENDFGYRLKETTNHIHILRYYWVIFSEPEIVTDTVDSATESLIDICEQARLHLKQAREHLSNSPNNDRARKDAVRDSLSAMEALINQLGGSADISQSIKNLRHEAKWGPDIIVKEGLSIWNQMHQLFPDIRHGNPICSNLTQTEALYWIDRLMAYLTYISRKNKEINL